VRHRRRRDTQLLQYPHARCGDLGANGAQGSDDGFIRR
jgi:hypothetical protein